MKKLLVALVMALAVLVLSSGQTFATRDASAVYPVLDKTSDQLTDKDIAEIAALISNRKISVNEMRKFYRGLSELHKNQIADLVIQQLPAEDRADPNEKAPVQEPAVENGAVTPETPLGCDPGAYPDCWRQPIEFYSNPFYQAQLPNSHYYLTTTCDTDPDNDLILYYLYNYMGNPNALMWGTNDQRIAAIAFTSPNFNSYGLNTNNSDVRMCIPERISGTFSIATIKSQIFITRNFAIGFSE